MFEGAPLGGTYKGFCEWWHVFFETARGIGPFATSWGVSVTSYNANWDHKPIRDPRKSKLISLFTGNLAAWDSTTPKRWPPMNPPLRSLRLCLDWQQGPCASGACWSLGRCLDPQVLFDDGVHDLWGLCWELAEQTFVVNYRLYCRCLFSGVWNGFKPMILSIILRQCLALFKDCFIFSWGIRTWWLFPLSLSTTGSFGKVVGPDLARSTDACRGPSISYRNIWFKLKKALYAVPRRVKRRPRKLSNGGRSVYSTH